MAELVPTQQSALHRLLSKLIPEHGDDIAMVLANSSLAVTSIEGFLLTLEHGTMPFQSEDPDIDALFNASIVFIKDTIYDKKNGWKRDVKTVTTSEFQVWLLNKPMRNRHPAGRPPHQILPIGDEGKKSTISMSLEQHQALKEITRAHFIGKKCDDSGVPIGLPEHHWSLGNAGQEKWFPNIDLQRNGTIPQCTNLDQAHIVYINARRLLHGKVNSNEQETLADRVSAFRSQNTGTDLGDIMDHLTQSPTEPLAAQTLQPEEGNIRDSLFLGTDWVENDQRFVLAVHLKYTKTERTTKGEAPNVQVKEFIFLYQPQVGLVIPQHLKGMGMLKGTSQQALAEYIHYRKMNDSEEGKKNGSFKSTLRKKADNWYGAFSRMLFHTTFCRSHEVVSVVKLHLRDPVQPPLPAAGGSRAADDALAGDPVDPPSDQERQDPPLPVQAGNPVAGAAGGSRDADEDGQALNPVHPPLPPAKKKKPKKQKAPSSPTRRSSRKRKHGDGGKKPKGKA